MPTSDVNLACPAVNVLFAATNSIKFSVRLNLGLSLTYTYFSLFFSFCWFFFQFLLLCTCYEILWINRFSINSGYRCFLHQQTFHSFTQWMEFTGNVSLFHRMCLYIVHTICLSWCSGIFRFFSDSRFFLFYVFRHFLFILSFGRLNWLVS